MFYEFANFLMESTFESFNLFITAMCIYLHSLHLWFEVYTSAERDLSAPSCDSSVFSFLAKITTLGLSVKLNGYLSS